MGSFLTILALSALLGVGLWFYGSHRRAMKRAHRAILDSQKRVLSNAEKEHDETEVRLHSVETEIEELGLSDLASRVDAVFSGGEPLDGAESMPSDDAD